MTKASDSQPVFRTVAVIGIGLIGSSVALAARACGAAERVRLCDLDPAARSEAAALELGEVCETVEAACRDADLVVLCVPVGSLGAAARSCAAVMKPGAVLSDVGSVKANVLTEMCEAAPASVHVVPAHPIAGTERSGPSAGFATLFRKRWCIITPRQDEAGQAEAYKAAVERLRDFWERMGSMVEVMDARRHDLVLSMTSHLPHLIAFNIVATAADMEQITEGEVVKFSAGGFRDFTRIAASDPTMWRDIFLYNKDAVLETLGRFTEDLAVLQRAIRWSDGETLFNQFTRARGIRRSVIEAGQDTDAPDFGRSAPPESGGDAGD